MKTTVYRVVVNEKAHEWLNHLLKMAREKVEFCKLSKEQLASEAILKVAEDDALRFAQENKSLKQMVQAYLKSDKDLTNPQRLKAILDQHNHTVKDLTK